ncbi:MAG TPA: 50S ribosomal protein L29 [Acidimicrobiales bacterium]|nr:50S ribosomal protein L29 [Acidimicrobiales bacterium]
MTTAREFRDLDPVELETRIENARKELFNLRFQAATGRLDNSARVGIVRREIARAVTVQREREIEQAEAAERSSEER